MANMAAGAHNDRPVRESEAVERDTQTRSRITARSSIVRSAGDMLDSWR